MGDPYRPRGGQFDRATRVERTMVRVRWAGVAFALVQILTYYRPYPPGIMGYALTVAGLLAAGNLLLHLGVRRAGGAAVSPAVSLASLALDTATVLAFVYLYTFDPETAMWAVVYVLPLEGALRFRLAGALGVMGVSLALYTAREVYGAVAYGNPFYATSISFRMGIGFIIATVAGTMASGLERERDRAERAKEHLEHSAAELEERNAELRVANAVKDDFVAMTNHEIRTPLTTILGYTATLRLHWDAIEDRQRYDFVMRVEEQGQRLLALVEGLLTLSALQAGGLHLDARPVRVQDIVTAALADNGRTPEEVDVRCPEDLCVQADPVRLRQVLTNYIANAMKYGQPPLVVEARGVDGDVEVAVVDHGGGVPDSFVPQLFERFTRAANGEAGSPGGAGLGLAIVRMLVEAQGGRVWYEPNHPAGSRFCVRLPRAELAAGAVESASGA